MVIVMLWSFVILIIVMIVVAVIVIVVIATVMIREWKEPQTPDMLSWHAETIS